MVNVTDLDRKLSTLESRHHELVELMGAAGNIERSSALAEIWPRVRRSERGCWPVSTLQKTRAQIADTERMMEDGLDPEMKELAYRGARRVARLRQDEQSQSLRLALLPKDIMDDRNAIVTIQAGRGWRRGWFVRGGPIPHVYAVRG